MKLENYHLRKSEDEKCSFFYGDLSYFDDEEISEYPIEVPQSEWTADQWCEVCSEILADANRHSFVDFPRQYLDSLRSKDIDEPTILVCIRLLVQTFYECI